MSSNPDKIRSYNPIPTSPPTPTIHLTPSTLPTPPTTPTSKPKPILKTRTSSTPISPISLTYSPPELPSDPRNPHPSLQYPLTRHLALLHPQTPGDIVNFCATRLLSTERPAGYHGTWIPIYEKDGGVEIDLADAGIGMDAVKGYERRKGKGKGEEVDKRLEGMYRAARESWDLEVKARQSDSEGEGR